MCIAVFRPKQRHNRPTNNQQPTLGQELMDLQKAKDSGAITAKEYDKLKEHLKKNYAPTES